MNSNIKLILSISLFNISLLIVGCVTIRLEVEPKSSATTEETSMTKNLNGLATIDFQAKEDKDKLITNQAQASVFEIVDYFSVNYPYSISQIEKHFNTNFTAKSRESAWFDVVLLYPRDGDTTNIAEMEIRSSDRGTQFFHIKLKQSVCFAGNKFRDKMKQDDYVLIARLGSLSFDRVMDKDKNFGKMELFFDPIDMDNEEICIYTINFSTSKTFDRSKYE